MCLPYDRMREPTAPVYYDRRAPEYDDWYLGRGRYADRDRDGFDEELALVEATLASLPPARTLDVACGTGFLTRHLAGTITGLDRSARMLELAAERLPGATLVEGDALSSAVPRRRVRPRRERPLLRAPRRCSAPDLPARSASRGTGARDRGRVDRALGNGGGMVAARLAGRLDLAGVQALVLAGGPPRGARRWRDAPRGTAVSRRPLATLSLDQRSFDRATPAGQRPLPAVSRRRVSDRPAAGLRRASRSACVSLRPRARPRRGGQRAAVAGTGRPHAPPLAAPGGRRVLRALLLRVRHPLLPGAERERPRRPSRDAGRGGALHILARGRAPSPAPGARRHRGPRSRLPAARRSTADGCRRQELPARRRRRRSRCLTRRAPAAGSTTRPTGRGWERR